MPWYYNEKTKLTLDIEEGSILHEVAMADENFKQIDGPVGMMPEGVTEATEDITGEAEDLSELSKAELINLAQLMGISVTSKDTVAQLRNKIEASREVK